MLPEDEDLPHRVDPQQVVVGAPGELLHRQPHLGRRLLHPAVLRVVILSHVVPGLAAMLDRLVTGHLVVVLPGVGWLLLRLVSPHQDVAEVGAGGEDALGRAPAQYSTVQHSTVQYSTVQYSTVQEEQWGTRRGTVCDQ